MRNSRVVFVVLMTAVAALSHAGSVAYIDATESLTTSDFTLGSDITFTKSVFNPGLSVYVMSGNPLVNGAVVQTQTDTSMSNSEDIQVTHGDIVAESNLVQTWDFLNSGSAAETVSFDYTLDVTTTAGGTFNGWSDISDPFASVTSSSQSAGTGMATLDVEVSAPGPIQTGSQTIAGTYSFSIGAHQTGVLGESTSLACEVSQDSGSPGGSSAPGPVAALPFLLGAALKRKRR